MKLKPRRSVSCSDSCTARLNRKFSPKTFSLDAEESPHQASARSLLLAGRLFEKLQKSSPISQKGYKQKKSLPSIFFMFLFVWKQTVAAGRRLRKAEQESVVWFVTSPLESTQSDTEEAGIWPRQYMSELIAIPVSTSEKSQAGLACDVPCLMKISQIKNSHHKRPGLQFSLISWKKFVFLSSHCYPCFYGCNITSASIHNDTPEKYASYSQFCSCNETA